jgi:hypothetical protein
MARQHNNDDDDDDDESNDLLPLSEIDLPFARLTWGE